MKKYGYVRVSSKDQNPERQYIALTEMGISQKNIYMDKLSGKDFSKPAYKKLLSKLKQGDLLVIKSIDRLGRNYEEILEQWRKITCDIRADIQVIDMPLLNTNVSHADLTGVFISDLVLQILAYVAETERSFIRQRQAEGIAAAKAKGVKFGSEKMKTPADFPEYYSLWKNGKISTRKAAQKLGMSHTTFYRRCREYEESQGDPCNRQYTCSNCRETKTEKIPATGHVWDNGRITTQPTASRNGIRTYTCQKCKATKTETINVTGLKVGATIKDTKSNGYYKVTDKKGLVSFVKPINTKKSSVTIPDTINYQGITCRVTVIGNNAFKGNKYVAKLKIGKYVTTVGSSSFYGCVKLSGVTLGNNTVKIGNYAFAKCTALSKLTIPSKVTTIGKQAFYGCKKLKSITIKTNKLTTKTVGSNCFKEVYAKPTIAVPNAKYSYYKKLLYARGVSSKAVFKKF